MPHTEAVRWLLIVLVAACDSRQAASPDAGMFQLTMSTFWADMQEAPRVEPRPTVYIDGVSTESLQLSYGDAADAYGQHHTVELWQGSLPVASSALQLPESAECLYRFSAPEAATITLCAYTYGELRYGSDTASGRADDGIGGCVGDGFCMPRCYPANNYGCTAGQKCTSIYASVVPIATHLGCAAIGTKALGESCTVADDGAGLHDDCGDHLLCVQGVCRLLCDVAAPGSCTCSYPLGYAGELRVCD
jgi:hypothetical protein